MASIIQVGAGADPRPARGAAAQPPSPLTPEMKEFIRRAIVPSLVKKYLADPENYLADNDLAAADSARSIATPKPRAIRP